MHGCGIQIIAMERLLVEQMVVHILAIWYIIVNPQELILMYDYVKTGEARLSILDLAIIAQGDFRMVKDEIEEYIGMIE